MKKDLIIGLIITVIVAGIVLVYFPKGFPGLSDEVVIPDSWQTYRNAEFGFNLRYPEHWNLTDTRLDPEEDSSGLNQTFVVTLMPEGSVNDGVQLFIWGVPVDDVIADYQRTRIENGISDTPLPVRAVRKDGVKGFSLTEEYNDARWTRYLLGYGNKTYIFESVMEKPIRGEGLDDPLNFIEITPLIYGSLSFGYDSDY